jgi:hypothetical protein
MKTKRLSELTYKLECLSSKKDIEAKDIRFLKVISVDSKSVNTKITIKDLVKGKPLYKKNEFTGYSFLQFIDKDILFLNEVDGEAYKIKRIVTPLVQWFDIKANEEEFEQIMNSIKPNEVIQEELIDAHVEEKEVGSVLEPFPEPTTLFQSEQYEIDKEDLIKEGYEEFKKGNLRLLYKEGFEPVLIELKDDNLHVFKRNEFEFNKDDLSIVINGKFAAFK